MSEEKETKPKPTEAQRAAGCFFICVILTLVSAIVSAGCLAYADAGIVNAIGWSLCVFAVSSALGALFFFVGFHGLNQVGSK